MVLVGGVFLTTVLFHVELGRRDHFQQMAWESHARLHLGTLEYALTRNREILAVTAALLGGEAEPNRRMFTIITQPILHAHQELFAIGWVPRVVTAQRPAFEMRAAADGYTQYRITEQNGMGEMVPVPDRAEYFPILYSEPSGVMTAAVGFDLASHPEFQRTLEASRVSGEVLATAPTPLMGSQAPDIGVLVFYPVYDVEQDIIGFVMGVYRMVDLIRYLNIEPEEGVVIEDVTEANASSLLYRGEMAPDTNGVRYQHAITVSGRSWQVTLIAPNESPLFTQSYYPWGIAIAGILLTLLLAGGYYLESRRRHQVEHLMQKLNQNHLKLEQSLHQVELGHRQWRDAFDSLADPIFLHNQRGEIIRANRAYSELCGASLAAIVGQPYWQLFPRREGPLHSCSLAQEHPGEEMVEEIVSETGLVYRSRGFTVEDGAGRYQYSLHVLEDLTRQRRAEAQIALQEARLRAVFDAPSDTGFILADFRGEEAIISEFNPGAEKLFLFSRQEAIGCGEEQLHQPQNRSLFRRISQEIRNGSPGWSGELVMLRRDGTTFPAAILCYPVSDSDHRVYASLCIIHDITRRKEAEAVLSEREETFRTLFEASADAIILLDISLTIRDCNRAALPLFGVAEEQDLIGRNPLQFSPPRQTDGVDSALALGALQNSLGSESRLINWTLLRPDSSTLPVEVHLCRITLMGREMVQASVRDISGRLRMQEQLQHEIRARRVLSAGNQLLVHTQEESELLQQLCELIAREEAYPLAWVGLVTEGAERIRIAGSAGVLTAEDVEGIRSTWGEREGEEEENIAAVVIRTGKLQLTHNSQEVRCRICRQLARRYHYHSTISFPLILNGGVLGALTIAAVESNAFTKEEVELLQQLADDLAYGIITLRSEGARQKAESAEHEILLKLESSTHKTVQAIASAVEVRDPYTAGHQQRVSRLAVAIAGALGLDEHRIMGIHLGATIHDIGKIYVPAEILNRPGRLSRAEFEIIKSHPTVGYDIIKNIDFPWPIASMVHMHHERLDGSGYPQGVGGEDLPLEARILAVADVVEAIDSHRPYRPTLGIAFAKEEIAKYRGSWFDPEVVDCCLELIEKKWPLW
ncbi:MAG: PAS domain S-box protein [Gammaproteobacteria bacterium]|nr:PAS domain S-box protein [Gammaproteobacteria bacterium]